jgi:hypothetical protein
LINRRSTGSNASNIDPAGAREYLGGSDAATNLAAVRQLMPNRRAISLVETPSAANALTSAHSNALRTSPVASRSIVADGLETADETGDNSRCALFDS